jgi:hypothetical protein
VCLGIIHLFLKRWKKPKCLFWDYPKVDLSYFVPIKDAYHERKRIELWGSPQHINMSHNILPKLIGVELACV